MGKPRREVPLFGKSFRRFSRGSLDVLQVVGLRGGKFICKRVHSNGRISAISTPVYKPAPQHLLAYWTDGILLCKGAAYREVKSSFVRGGISNV